MTRLRRLSGATVSAVALLLLAGAATVLAHENVIYGTDGRDTDRTQGHEHFDEIHARAGNDDVEGFGNGDKLYGQDGDDEIGGGDGQDLLDGGNGNDSIMRGADGDDELVGDRSADYLRGGNAEDIHRGNEGNDGLESDGDLNYDSVYGGEGDDTCFVDSFDFSESCRRF